MIESVEAKCQDQVFHKKTCPEALFYDVDLFPYPQVLRLRVWGWGYENLKFIVWVSGYEN